MGRATAARQRTSRRRGRHERPPVTVRERFRNLMLLDPLPDRAEYVYWEPGGRKCHDRVAVALVIVDAGARLAIRQQCHVAYTRLEVMLTFLTGLIAACMISMAGVLLGIVGATPLALAFGYCAAGVAVGSALSILRVARMSMTAGRSRRRSNRDPLAFGLSAIGGIQEIPVRVYTVLDGPIMDELPCTYADTGIADAEHAGAALVQDISAWLTAELGSEIAEDTFNSLALEFDGTIGELAAVSRDLARP